jgi:hypothetical protein
MTAYANDASCVLDAGDVVRRMCPVGGDCWVSRIIALALSQIMSRTITVYENLFVGQGKSSRKRPNLNAVDPA